MKLFINHSNLFKKTRLLAVLFAILFLPQGLWAQTLSKTYTFTSSTPKVINEEGITRGGYLECNGITTWELGEDAIIDDDREITVNGNSPSSPELTSVDDFHYVRKITVNVTLPDYDPDQPNIQLECNGLNEGAMGSGSQDIVFDFSNQPYYPNGPLTIGIYFVFLDIFTLNSITVEYETTSWLGNTMEFDGYQAALNWSERETAQFPTLGYWDPNWENASFIPLSGTELSEITFTSSNTNVATISNGANDKGHVTILSPGSTTIHANYPGNTRYGSEEASYDLVVYKEYDLWIGNIQVTEGNCKDILGDGYATQGSAASFQYFPDLNKLFITNNADGLNIETNNDEGLTIYLAPNSTNSVGRIGYGGKGNAPLTITTDGNYPGNITLSANSNAISGFNSLTLEQNLVVMDPEDLAYDTNNWCLATTTATIGAPLTPITEEKTIKPDGNKLKPEAGSSDINKVVDDILYTLGNTDDSNNGDGYDDGGFVVINSVTSDQQAMNVSKNCIPGTDEYLEEFKGLTFMVPAGNGDILFDMETPDGYAMKVMVGDAAPVTAKKLERGILKIPYNVAEPTYVYVWNGGQTSDASTARGIQKGKMTTVHIKVYTVGTKPNKVKPSNPAAEASGGEYQGDVMWLEGQDIETEEEIEASKGDVNGDENANVADIVGIVNAICGSHSATFDKRAADANGDTVIDAKDIVIIVNKIMGK